MTRGMVEAKFTKAIIQFEKEHLGRGPLDARTIFLNDMILVRLKGLMTPAEQKLAASTEGRDLVKEMRRQLFESSRPLIEDIVRNVTDCQLISLHTDMSTKTGERMIVLVVDEDLDKKYPLIKGKR
ncbi:DUF2294 domain-containing protein [Chloroflexi bacterium TSY]|nr:DUF2294 domain-containing protein [Chloroflexi bacterium TSY]